MTYCTAPAPLAPLTATMARFRPNPEHLRRSLRNMAIAVFLLLTAGMILHAEEVHPDWLPDVLHLPSDREVLTDRAIGSTLRMYSFNTEQDADMLLGEWEDALQQGGYSMDQSREDVLDQVIEFSGNDINNAKIVVPPLNDEGRTVIEFDATLK